MKEVLAPGGEPHEQRLGRDAVSGMTHVRDLLIAISIVAAKGIVLRWRTSDRMTEAWVYLLRCSDDSLYTGWTTDLERRLARHQSGTASKYTASRLPVHLALSIPMSGRTSARREEARIKRLTRSQKLELINSQTPR